ncbi:hypothetical protein AMTRI_Chr09g13130 [Amborella trichopoda]
MACFSIFFCIFFVALFTCSMSAEPGYKEINASNPVLLVFPRVFVPSHGKTTSLALCDRVRVKGLSRLNLKSYPNSFRVAVTPSEKVPEAFHHKISVCLHQNASLGLCDCPLDEWETIQKGAWSSVISPYGERLVDVKFTDGFSGSVTISAEEESHPWRLAFLAFGLVVLLLAPYVSKWVPFYYTSSMLLGIIVVILILLFQGMKLLPTGRKNAFYLALYGSLVGLGSYIAHYFSTVVNSILLSFGLDEEMHSPVSIFLVVGILIAGAWLGYWGVRKFVLSEDGSVDIGVAQFVKWAMRIIGTVCILQSSKDALLATGSLAACWCLCSLMSCMRWRPRSGKRNMWHPPGNRTKAEFFRRTPPKMGAQKALIKASHNRQSPSNQYSWSGSPTRGLVLTPSRSTSQSQNYYSTVHKDPTRKRFSKKEWEEFTRESTREAIRELASSPEFTEWMIEHSDHIHLVPEATSDETTLSESDSSDETCEESCGISLSKWWS